MESYSDSEDDGLEIGRHGDGSEAAADIFSYFFWRNFMVKQVALVALGTWALMFLATVLHRWILFAFTFAISSGMFDSGHGCTQSFPCFFNWRPTLQPWFLAASLE